MELLLVLLLLGLLGLGFFTLTLSDRLKRLERRLEEGGVAAEAASVPGPAVIVRTAASSALPEPAPAAAAADAADRRSALLGAEEAFDTFEGWRAAQPRESVGGFFERWVGGRLMIWVGGIAISVAGVLFVRWSVQNGFITPSVQMLLAAAFGLALLGAGELARRRPGWSSDLRVAQALTGAGILVLYATAYGALVVHHLIGNGTAFALMVAITAAALALSLRHGAPAAAMGLIGGFATPVLVGERSDTAIPLLTYLALLDVALFAVAGRRGWTWLAAAAALASFAWGGAVLLWGPADAIASGVFLLLVGLAASLLRAGEGRHLALVRPAAIALVELALLTARIDVGFAGWALFGLLSAACFWLQARRVEYRALPAIALGLAAALILFKSAIGDADMPLAAVGVTLLFALGSLPRALRGRDWLAAGTFGGALLVPAALLRLTMPELLSRPLWGALFAGLAAAASLPLWVRARKAEGDGEDAASALAAGTSALLLGAAAYDLLPPPLVAAGWAAIALALAYAARRLGNRRVAELAILATLGAAARAAAVVPQLWETVAGSLAGTPALAPHLPGIGLALQDLLLPAVLFAALWRVLPSWEPRYRALPLALAALFAGAAAYVVFKQAFGLSSQADFVARGLAERTLVNQALFLTGWLVCRGTIPVRGLEAPGRWLAGTLMTALAAARLLWFDMLLHNPLLVAQNVGSVPALNLLAPSYLLGAWWLYRARRGAANALRSAAWLGLSLLSLVLGVMMMVRQGFHGALLSGPDLPASESYAYSVAGLLLSVALLLSGIRLRDKALRLAGLVLLTATTVKVFGLDAKALEGVLRILSFLFLGIALVLIGKLYTRVLDAEARPAAPAGE